LCVDRLVAAIADHVRFWHIASLQRVAEFGRYWSNSGLVRKGSEALGAKANAALSAIEQAMAGA
jgi:hypothetical protein